MKETNVGLGEAALSRNADEVLVAYGLGSCIGVAMIDPVSKFSGLLHAVLPRAGAGSSQENPRKYVESGIEDLLASLIKAGASPTRLITRIVGGANMMKSTSFTQTFDIGTRNIEAARTTLNRLKLAITAAEVGGHTGRTVRVYVAESRVTVRLVGEKEHDL